MHHAAPSTESILILLFHRVRSTSSLWIMSIPAVSVCPCVCPCARMQTCVSVGALLIMAKSYYACEADGAGQPVCPLDG